MPKYTYYCSECEQYNETRHSMSETLNTCPACEFEDALTRVPSTPVSLLNKGQDIDPQAGDIVKEYIEDNKQSLKEMKNELRKEYE